MRSTVPINFEKTKLTCPISDKYYFKKYKRLIIKVSENVVKLNIFFVKRINSNNVI